MNYRHAFHAGNHADVLKHAVLLLCLERMLAKPKPLTVLDSHAGRGWYSLDAEEAHRSPEWRDGAGRIWNWAEAPAPLHPLQLALQRCNPGGELRSYPGSPMLVQAMLRPQDRHVLCELHPEEAAALRAALSGEAQVHQRDGFASFAALLPPSTGRGLVLLDPPYEQPDELERCVASLVQGLRRFRQGVFVWWRPLKHIGRIDAADAELAAAAPLKALRADLAVRAQGPEGLAASSVVVINPPFGLHEALQALLPAVADRLAQGEGGGARVQALGLL